MGYPWIIQKIKDLLNTADNLQSQIDNFEAFPDYSDAEGLQLGIENGAPVWGDFTGAVRSATLLAARQAVASGGGGEVGGVTLEGVAAEVASLGGEVASLGGEVASKAGVDASNFSAAGKSVLAGLGMPGDRSMTLTLGASGTTYTAPANGVFYISGTASSANGFVVIYGRARNGMTANGGRYGIVASCFCRKGEVVTVTYGNMSSDVELFFIYADGEEA